MANEGSRSDRSGPDPSHPAQPESPERRQFLETASRTAMVAGVAGGYGGFALIAGKYLYPATTGEVMWQFVTEADAIDVGDSVRYQGPSGETIRTPVVGSSPAMLSRYLPVAVRSMVKSPWLRAGAPLPTIRPIVTFAVPKGM